MTRGKKDSDTLAEPFKCHLRPPFFGEAFIAVAWFISCREEGGGTQIFNDFVYLFPNFPLNLDKPIKWNINYAILSIANNTF
jgi:hypothetical protein